MPDFRAFPRLLILISLLWVPGLATSGTVSGELKKWHTVVVDFAGPLHDEMDSSPNPFLDYRLQVTFTGPSGATYDIPGFFDGDGNGGSTGSVWRARFAPDEAGTWTYSASFRSGTNVAVSLDPAEGSPHTFDGDSGTFSIAGLDTTADGFLKEGRLESVGEYYFKFRDGDYWIKGGMDSPENVFGYDGFDNTPVARHHFNSHVQDWQVGDPDWDSSNTPGIPEDGRAIIGMLNYLASQNLNSIYFMPMNIGADGKDTWPYASTSINRNGSSGNDNVHYDISKLRQWNTAFDHAQRKGIFLHFVLSDREAANKNELDNATLGVERKLYYRELIARFGHFNALQWNICEEYNLHLPLDPNVIKEFAQYINDVDSYDHPVTVHPHGNTYVNALAPFVGDTRFGVMTVQTWQQPENIDHAIEHFRTETAAAGHIVPTAVDESIGLDQLSATVYRKRAIWDAMLSGGGHELFVRYQDSQLNDFRQFAGHYQALWYARKFVQENLPFWEMTPNDALVTGEDSVHGGAEVFYKQGEFYAVYLPSTTTQATLSLNGAGGTYVQRWYDPRTGQFAGDPIVVQATSSIALGNPPSSVGEDWAVLVSSSTGGGGGNEPFQQSTAPDGLLSIEAESFHQNNSNGGKDWLLIAPGGESGTGAMEAAPNSGANNKTNYESASPRLDYEVEFEHAGTHYIWIRGIGASDFDDSVHVGLDGSGSSSSEGITYFVHGSGFSWANTSLVTSAVATINVPAPGLHTLNVWMREDGFVFDKIVLTKESTLDPEVVYGPFGPAQSQRVTPTASDPIITPAAGTYFGSVDVTITADAGASIHYTTDGSDPDSSSALYGGPIAIATDTTVQAIAIAAGMADSSISSAAYVITNELLPPTIDPPGGSYLDSVVVTMTASVGTIHYTTDGTLPTNLSPQYAGPLTLTTATTVHAITALSGFVDSAPAEESYTITTAGGGEGFFIQSASGDGLVSIEAENYQGDAAQGGHSWIPTAPGGQSGAGAMEAFPNSNTNRNSGYESNSPRLDYEVNFEETGTHYVWIRGYGASGTDDSLHVGVDGAAVSSADRISFFNASFGWSKDTMDGSVATINIDTTGPHTVNVWMREDGFIIDKIVLTTDSGLDVEAVYGPSGPPQSPFGQPAVSTPTINPASGSYFGSVDVMISGEPGAAIHYTTDGTLPTSASTLYTGQFTRTTDTVVNAIAVIAGRDDSAIATADYTITTDLVPPTISPASGAYLNSVDVTITTTNGAVHYTMDGSLPSGASPLYTGPINLATDATIRAVSVLAGYADSAPVEESYTISVAGGGEGVFMQSDTGDGLVSIEAENYQAEVAQGGHSWTPSAPGGQSGGGAMEAAPNSGALNNSGYKSNSPRLDFQVEFVETGTHYVWIRGLGATTTDDSLHVGLDGDEVSSADRITFFSPTFTWSKDTMDGSVATLNIATPGVHTINVWMREDGFIVDKIVLTTNSGLDIEATYGANGPAQSPFGQPALLPPMISPAGGTYFASVDVTMVAEPGAEIRYTTDGSTPTASSTLYLGAVSLTSDTTVQAIAVMAGRDDSPVASESYVISNQLLPPSISPSGGNYLDSVTVTMTSATGDSIHYTTDGSLPTSASPQYTVPLVFAADTVIRAITARSGFTDSPPVQESYIITPSGGGGGVFVQSTSGDGLLSMEAENYHGNFAQGAHTWDPVAPGGQSGLGAMEANPNSNIIVNSNYVTQSPRLDYEVNFEETGTHYVWIRGYGASGTDDSLHVGIDGVATNTADRISFFNASFGWSNTTMDSGSAARVDVTSTGIHTINVWMREDGFIVDKIVLTTELSFNPEIGYGPNGPPESPLGAPPPLTAPSISPAGGTFYTDLTVSIVADSPSDTIRYTTNGSDPDSGSMIYTGPFSVTADTTVKAIATRPGGYANSPVAQEMFSQTACLNTRITPLGDSITNGKDAAGLPPASMRVGYRRDLYFSLVENGYNVNFIGAVDDGGAAIPVFDSDHEGYPGITAGSVAANVYNWLAANPADVILLHIGTNNLTTNVSNVAAILDEIDRYDPGIHVVLAKIINRQSYSANTTTFNNNLGAMALARIGAGDLITVVDMESALDYPDDLEDNLHPNPAGYRDMADVWFNALTTILPGCVAP